MHQLLGFQVTIGRTATKNRYAAAGEWSCECLHCPVLISVRLCAVP